MLGISLLFKNDDERLHESAAELVAQRSKAGLDGLVGDLQAVIINVEPGQVQSAAVELLANTGLHFFGAWEDDQYQTCLLIAPDSADFLLRSRKNATNPFAAANPAPKAQDLPNTRLEAFIFETPDIAHYVSMQQEQGIQFLTPDIGHTPGYSFIQTTPSQLTLNSCGFVQWNGPRNWMPSDAHVLDWNLRKPPRPFLCNIGILDHAATRLRAEDRDSAILEFMKLTNYNFDFAIYVPSLNSITNVARHADSQFAMVFTSGISPYIDEQQSGPTEKFVHNYGPRTHHLAFRTDLIDHTYQALVRHGQTFLIDLVGSPEEGLKQTFTTASPHTMIVNEYIHRYGDFDGFFTKSNVAMLTEATGKQ